MPIYELSPTKDAHIEEEPLISSDDLAVGTADPGGNAAPARRRSLLTFSLSSIPTEPGIRQATLHLRCIQAAAGAREVAITPLTATWTESVVSWTHRTILNWWTTPGGDYESFGSPPDYGFDLPTSTGPLKIDLTGLVEEKLAGGELDIIALRTDEVNNIDEARFASREHSTQSWRPKLVVDTYGHLDFERSTRGTARGIARGVA